MQKKGGFQGEIPWFSCVAHLPQIRVYLYESEFLPWCVIIHCQCLTNMYTSSSLVAAKHHYHCLLITTVYWCFMLTACQVSQCTGQPPTSCALLRILLSAYATRMVFQENPGLYVSNSGRSFAWVMAFVENPDRKRNSNEREKRANKWRRLRGSLLSRLQHGR